MLPAYCTQVLRSDFAGPIGELLSFDTAVPGESEVQLFVSWLFQERPRGPTKDRSTDCMANHAYATWSQVLSVRPKGLDRMEGIQSAKSRLS